MTAHATELADLDKTRQAHIAALNAGDAHRWAACFAADAVQMPPNDPPNASPESIRAWSNALPGRLRREVLAPPGRSHPHWRRLGLRTRHLHDHPHARTRRRAGPRRRQVHQRRADDTWVMARDIWNSNNPVPSGRVAGARQFPLVAPLAALHVQRKHGQIDGNPPLRDRVAGICRRAG